MKTQKINNPLKILLVDEDLYCLKLFGRYMGCLGYDCFQFFIKCAKFFNQRSFSKITGLKQHPTPGKIVAIDFYGRKLRVVQDTGPTHGRFTRYMLPKSKFIPLICPIARKFSFIKWEAPQRVAVPAVVGSALTDRLLFLGNR